MFSKKTLIILGIIIIVIVGVFILLLSLRKDNTTSKDLTPYNSSSFALSYPKAWKVDKRGVVGGGESFTARVDSSTVFFPRFTVESSPFDASIMDQKLKTLSFYKLKETNTTFKGYPAVKLEGILNMKFDTGNPEQKPVHKVFLLVKGESNLYIISYAYFIDQDEAKSEEQMQQMLNSVEIR